VLWPLRQRQNPTCFSRGSFNYLFQPTRNADGWAAGILVHVVEVTAQVRARQRIEALAAENARLYHDAQAEARPRGGT
jgi:hypothetical protein